MNCSMPEGKLAISTESLPWKEHPRMTEGENDIPREMTPKAPTPSQTRSTPTSSERETMSPIIFIG
jgi:hypothetical protein